MSNEQIRPKEGKVGDELKLVKIVPSRVRDTAVQIQSSFNRSEPTLELGLKYQVVTCIYVVVGNQACRL